MNRYRTIILLFCVLLAGCEQQALYSKLTESEANEMVARLYASGIPVEKVLDTDGSFRVDVEKSSFSNAVGVLQSHGLPRERFQSVGDIFDKDGFVSSPLEERARLNYALSQEISKTISSIDGVIMARVHLAVPKKEHLADSVAKSSASVFVKHRDSVDLSASIGKIKSLVVTGFENLPYENVTVSLFSANIPELPGQQSVDQSVYAAAIGQRSSSSTIVIFALLIGILLLVVGFAFLRYSNVRVQSGNIKRERKL